MARWTLDQKRLLNIHAQLDPINYSVGGGTGKAKYGAKPKKIASLDCSGYVHYILHEASEGKIVIGKGPYWVNSGGIRDWAKKRNLKSVNYARSASKIDNVLRLAYLPPSKSYGHIWLVLNGKTLESHGSKGVNRRAWNTSVLKNNVTDCFEIARTTVLSPAKYRVSAKVKDPEVRRMLEDAIDDDKRINAYEVCEILLGVLSDDKLTAQELKDLKSILEYSNSLKGPNNHGRKILEGFLLRAKDFQQQTKTAVPRPSSGNLTPTQRADKEFYRRHPELNGRPLTGSKADAPLRREWIKLYRQFGGK